jgi:glycosyltransferase involved in cell wall biosynthesis
VLDGVGRLDHVVPIPGGLVPTRMPVAWGALRRLATNYDIVHAHGLTAGWLATLARRGHRPAVVVTVHNLVLDEAAGRAAPALRVLERRLPARVDGVIAVSDEIAGYLNAERVTMIGPLGPRPKAVRTPAATRAALGLTADAPLIVAVARLHPQKGLDVLLAAMPRVLQAVPAAVLAVVGEGPLAASLRSDASRLGLDAHVRFAPPTNPADELAAADVVAIPSRWESGPLVLGEAMLLGRPVVATPVGSVQELIADGATGWLVPVGDPSALAAGLIDALTNTEDAARRAAAGLVKAESTLDMARRVSDVEAVYRASLGRP